MNAKPNFLKMKKLILLPLVILLFNAVYAQDYMNNILESTCNCAGKVSDTLEMNQFNMAIGACMIEAAMPYKKQLKKEHGVNLDKFDLDAEKLGTIIGVKMASYCPDVLLRLTQKSQKKETPEVSKEEIIIGKVVKIDTDLFVVFHLRDEKGKTTKLTWLTFVESDVDHTSDYSSMVGKSLEIQFRREDMFDPKLNEYRQFLIITKLNEYMLL
jgi:hypothetical protein